MFLRIQNLLFLQKPLLLIAAVSTLGIIYNLSSKPQSFVTDNLHIQPNTPGAIPPPENQTPIPINQHSKWIIVTSISYPTEQIKKLSTISGWQLLVVADKKTPSNWTYPGVIFLDIDTQLNLGYRVLEYLPWNAYTRKVIGYLYAIQHNATIIYDTDDDNAPDDVTSFETNFAFGKTCRGLLLPKESYSVVNPYAHFGQGSIWPRGYPLNFIGQDYNNTYTPCIMSTALIQQGLVNGDPDVDAIFRLTRKKLHTPLNIQFDPSAPPVFYPKYVAAPFNSQNTIFHYDAFWALLLPVSVAFRVTDIWRGYWAQGLLWKIRNGHLSFFPAYTTQLRNPHTYLRDFGEEDQMYKQAGDLVELLKAWECSAPDLYGCMIQLTEIMVENEMYAKVEMKLVAAWISDLTSIGYKEPSLDDSKDRQSPCLNKNQTQAIFSAVEIPPKPNGCPPKDALRKFCNLTMGQNTSSDLSTPVSFPSMLLIVTYNFPHYENIWLMDSIYRPHFPNILYCGTLTDFSALKKLLETKPFIESSITSFSFVHADVDKGYFEYECAMRAIEMGYSVSGILLASDDIVLNFWNIGNFDPNAIWQAEDLKIEEADLVNLEDPKKSRNMVRWWAWWEGPMGLEVTKKALNIIYAKNASTIVQQFKSNRESEGFNSSVAIGSMSDSVYIPASKHEMFYEVALILRECKVFLEIAFPILISGLTPRDSIIYLPGKNLWQSDRDLNVTMSFYNSSHTFLHPVKFYDLVNVGELRKEYCDKYIADVLNL